MVLTADLYDQGSSPCSQNLHNVSSIHIKVRPVTVCQLVILVFSNLSMYVSSLFHLRIYLHSVIFSTLCVYPEIYELNKLEKKECYHFNRGGF